MLQRLLATITFVAGLSWLHTAIASDPFEMEWRELAKGVWVGVRPVSYRTPVVTNTTVVIGKQGVMVFDAAGLAIQGERLVEKVAELTDKPVTHIVFNLWFKTPIVEAQYNLATGKDNESLEAPAENGK